MHDAHSIFKTQLRGHKVMQSSEVLIEEEIQTRVRLYDFSTGKQTFFQWQAGMLPSLDGKKVLELGCGNGALWRDLMVRCSGAQLTLTDINERVLESTKENIASYSGQPESVSFDTVDFNNLDYPNDSFDVVIANHNLFYAEDVPSVLESIAKILKPGGFLISSTIGKDHLHELIRALRHYRADIPWGAEAWAEKFGLDNGAKLLLQHFQRLDQFEYDNNLHVNSVEPVISYLKRTMKGTLCAWVKENADIVNQAMKEIMNDKGYIRLTPHSGFFIAYRGD